MRPIALTPLQLAPGLPAPRALALLRLLAPSAACEDPAAAVAADAAGAAHEPAALALLRQISPLVHYDPAAADVPGAMPEPAALLARVRRLGPTLQRGCVELARHHAVGRPWDAVAAAALRGLVDELVAAPAAQRPRLLAACRRALVAAPPVALEVLVQRLEFMRLTFVEADHFEAVGASLWPRLSELSPLRVYQVARSLSQAPPASWAPLVAALPSGCAGPPAPTLQRLDEAARRIDAADAERVAHLLVGSAEGDATTCLLGCLDAVRLERVARAAAAMMGQGGPLDTARVRAVVEEVART